ncbi:MAG: winged helix-turn-helix transcriptional regulator [Bacteroidetes bacterium]|nr:winged helix-turn-helix transcriptional regulator [Bacteroidota bacterium]
MGTTKNEYFTEKQNTITQLLKAVAHPARIAIVEYLLKVDSCICGDIVNELPLAQPTISQHLKELKTAGIIKGKIEGNAICYCIDEAAIQKIKDYFISISSKLEKKRANCC